MKKQGLSLVLASLMAASGAVYADSPWQIRVRAIDVQPDLSTNAALSTLEVSDELVPELDISYFITPNIAAELILGTARHELNLGPTKLGKLSHLPPTVTVQYHFAPDAQIRPYVGAGLNYTRFYDVGLAGGIDVSRNSFGPALQAGVDIAVTENTFINLDVKKIYIDTDVKAGGTKLGNVELDPLVIGVGYGIRF